MVGALRGIADDVKFDYAAAEALASACDTAAAAIDGQASTRASAVSKGLTDFRGHFSELFRSNAAVAAGDAQELAARLHEVSVGAVRLAEEARKEQHRREKARAWQIEHDNRSYLEQMRDAGTGGDDPPVGPAAEEPTISVSAPVNRSRETPAGGGGRGGGTSSARPGPRTYGCSRRSQKAQTRTCDRGRTR